MQDWLAHRADATPAAEAVVDAETDRLWTYAELDAAVTEAARNLAGLDIGRGDHVGVLMETSVEFVCLVHASMRLGAVLVPLNARLSADELAVQCETADLSAVVCNTDTETAAVTAANDTPVASVDDPRSGDVQPFTTSECEYSPADLDLNDAVVMLFTSGTTGDSKAVVLTNQNLLASATASAFRLGINSNDRWLVCLSMYHMGGLAPVLRSTLYGTTVVLQDGFDAAAANRAIAEYDVTGVSLVPTMLRRMLDEGELSDTLRFVLLGGAPTPDQLVERCDRLGVPVHPTYGMTETASQVATARPDEAFEHVGTVGSPLMFTDVTVLDEDEVVLPQDEVGELVVSGPTVTPGYYANSAANDDVFCQHGLRTGDVGYRDDNGRLWVLDRKDDQIITGGENVPPGEVVAVLRQHSSIRDAAVVGLDDSDWGERVAALVVPEDDANVTEADVDAFCRDRLAGYKRPRTIVIADALPRTASGTVKRDAVRERLRDIAP